ncbi:MAG: DUF305 domain-containing protein [Candidatus Paceibacterota bacterium]
MKNNILFVSSLLALAVGLLIGYSVWGTRANENNVMSSSTFGHRMPNGQMMNTYSGMDMTTTMNGMMQELQGKNGDAFDQAFLSQMIVHHQGAVVMAEAVLKTSKRPELLKLAKDIITAQTKEIEMMQGWERTWFK